MSELKVNKISPRSGTDVTLGDSGDTFTIPAGATLSSTDPLVFPAGTASAPAVTTTGDTNTGIFFPSADTIAFTEGGTEAMRINSDGDVGIGTTSPTVSGIEISRNTGSASPTPAELRIATTTNASDWSITDPWGRLSFYSADGSGGGAGVHAAIQVTTRNTGGGDSRLEFLVSDTVNKTLFKTLSFNPAGTNTTRTLFFSGSGTERMRIDSSGNVLIGKTTNSFSTAGIDFPPNGKGVFVVDGDECIICNRLTNDGNLIRFYQAGIEEGNISVSGATVSYNGFTGSHWSRFIDESKPDVLRGTVMESLDQMTDWYAVEFEVSTTEKDADGNDVVKTTTQKEPYALKANEQEGDVITYAWNTEKKDEDDNDIIEQVQATIVKEKDVKHVMSKISDTSEAKNVYGVFSAWDNDDLINNDFYVASVGSYVVRIKAGQVVSKGDLLQSNGDGTAKVQADDLVRASSFAKVLSNTVIETYEDGSFIVPCSLMC